MVETGNLSTHDAHERFARSGRTHVLMITNHGVHEWKVVPGMPDTGGQNVYVNQFTEALVEQGYRVTITNRGGYPHPRTGERQAGLHYEDKRQRILYIEDGGTEFVRKEDMDERIPHLVESLVGFLDAEGTKVDLILSHYWDGAKVGALYNRTLTGRAKHIWVPHSLGIIKKRNVSPDRWADLRIDERIAVERKLIEVKDRLPHVSFGSSMEAEFGRSRFTAYRFMNVATRFEMSQFETFDIGYSALYALAAPSIPDEVVADSMALFVASD